MCQDGFIQFSIGRVFLGRAISPGQKYTSANVTLLSLIYVGQRGGIVNFKVEPSILGETIKLAHCKKYIYIELGRHLIY
jgi:hypothetical protein